MVFLVLLVSIVLLNVMIAFIMETYKKILDDKNAVLICMKASCMMEMYCLMSEDYQRDKIERANR